MKMEIGRSNISGRWLFSKKLDLIAFFIPVWLVWLVFFSFSAELENSSLPLWAWVIFILGIDVSHVWSSLFRTYLDKEEFQSHKKLLTLAPILLVIISMILLFFSELWFWRAMAYVAVFHFIKQQYGFLALYNTRLSLKPINWRKDKYIIYIATLYPIIFWHFNSSSKFNWFVEYDFVFLHDLISNKLVISNVFSILNVAYWILIALWLGSELWAFNRTKQSSIGKMLWVSTTALNWWFGIVYFNSDLVFSISNVVAHGIPYIALIYFYNYRKKEVLSKAALNGFSKLKILFGIVVMILIIAFTEEYFWDMLVNRNKSNFFETVLPYSFNQLTGNWTIITAISLLALPQQMHYILDGFIWKMSTKNPYLRPIFTRKHES